MAAAALSCQNAAWAHHSAAMFDKTQDLAVEGSLKDMQWTSPHAWLIVESTAADGSLKTWSVEAPPPSVLQRLGIKKSDFVTGDKVTVHLNPVKDGQSIGLFVSLTRSDGRVVALTR